MAENFFGSIQFFGDVDRDKRTGQVNSEYPAWTLNRQEAELRETIAQRERALARRDVAPSEIGVIEAALAKERVRLSEIEASKPKIEENKKDELYSSYKEIGKKVAESLFTRTDMERGLADPHEEARRMVSPCIEGIDPELARSCNVKMDERGRVSRDGASKIYKILGKFLGENTNVEYLRKAK